MCILYKYTYIYIYMCVITYVLYHLCILSLHSSTPAAAYHDRLAQAEQEQDQKGH